MRVIIYSFVLTLSLFFSHRSMASEEHIKVELNPNKHVSLNAFVGSITGNTVTAAVSFKLQDGWHIYAEDPGDTGMPTKFLFKDEELLEYRVHLPKYREDVLRLGKKVFKSNIYSEFVLFPLTLKLRENVKKVHLEINFAACGEVCIPERIVLSLDVPESGFQDDERLSLIQAWLKK